MTFLCGNKLLGEFFGDSLTVYRLYMDLNTYSNSSFDHPNNANNSIPQHLKQLEFRPLLCKYVYTTAS